MPEPAEDEISGSLIKLTIYDKLKILKILMMSPWRISGKPYIRA